jgi:hypothetical protein
MNGHARCSAGIVRFAAAVVVLTAGLAAPAAAQGPVAYYPFNGSFADSSGFGNHAVDHGAYLVADRNGTPNSALLVGNHGHLEAPDADSLDMVDAYSVCAWIRLDEVLSSSQPFLGKGAATGYKTGVSYGGSWVCPDSAAARSVSASVGGAVSAFALAPSIECGTGRWYHVAVTVATESDGDQLATLYLDGLLQHSFSLGGNFANNAAPLGIGMDTESNARFGGAVDDLQLYDRALSAAEVSEVYSAILTDGFESGSTSAWTSVAQ